MKNYYKIMGLKMTATEAEIKSTYRLLAKRYHPDMNPGNATAAEKFAALTEAYDTLSDPTKKAAYDRQLSDALRRQSYGTGWQGGATGYSQQQQTPFSQQKNTAYNQSAYQNFARQNQYSQNNFGTGARTGFEQTHGQYARAQFVQQQIQTQQWMKKVAEAQRDGYTKGYEAGKNDARARYGVEIEQLKADIDAAKIKETEYKEEISRLKRELDDEEADFETLKSVSGEETDKLKKKAEKLERELETLRNEQRGKAKLAASDSATIKSLKEKLAATKESEQKAKERVAELEKEVSELTGKLFRKETALTDLKLENSRLTSEKAFYEEEAANAKKLAQEREEEIDLLNQTVAQWEDFSDSLDTAEAMKNLKGQWEKQLRDAKKKLKNTHYGTLGVLYIATQDEIKESFRKLYKRYTRKAETDKSFEEKLYALSEAFKVLSDEAKRKEYNAQIGVTDEEIEEFALAKQKHEDSMEQLEQKQDEREFWVYVEDLMYNAQIGDTESQNKLGEMYFSGDELERDPEQAVYWFKEAAKSKYPRAFFNLGVCFLTGDGVEEDREKGEGFIKQAAKLGCEDAQALIDAGYDVNAL